MKKTIIESRPDNEYRTQDQWIPFFNEQKKPMISVPVVFQLVKENNLEAIQSLRKDFKDHWLVTSTRIIYNPNDLSGSIIHNAGSIVVKPTEIKLKKIPECRPTYLIELLETESGLNFVRALLNNPKAKREQIIETFEELSGKKAKKIRFWTPSQSSRADRPVRSVGLYFDCGRFYVVGDCWVDFSDGFTRGVLSDSAKRSNFPSKIMSKGAMFDFDNKIITIPMKRELIRDMKKRTKNKGKVKIDWKLKTKLK